MLRKLALALFLLVPLATLAQDAPVTGYCVLGSSQASVSGLLSTNNQQGIIPSCTVSVYMTGTNILANPIYSNATGTPLSNPFTAPTSGQWTFYSAAGAAYDIVLSGGISPNSYPAPVVIPGQAPNILALLSDYVSLTDTFTQTLAGPLDVPIFNNFVYVEAGESIPHAVTRLPSTGGTVLVPNGTYSGGVITESNVSVIGSGMPLPNTSGQPSFVSGSGTIIMGGLQFLGASNVRITDLGADVGDNFNSGACTAQGLQVDSANQGLADPMIFNVDLENVWVIACDYAFAPSALQHSTLLEHITNLKENNVNTQGGVYGNVIKAIDADLTKINSSGSNSYCFIIKSDDTNGVSTNVSARGITCRNGGGLAIDTFGGTVSDISLDGVAIYNTLGTVLAPIALEGHIASDPATGVPGAINGVKISHLVVNGALTDSVVFQNGSTNISIDDASVSNITGNAVVFQSTGQSGNSVDNLRLNTISGYGLYSFGANDYAKNVSCFGVVGACLVSSGSGATITAENLMPGTSTPFTSLAGGAVQRDYIPGGIITPRWVAPAGVTPTIIPGAGSAFTFNVTDPTGTINNFLIDTPGNWVNRAGNIVFPATASGWVGSATGGPLLVLSGPVGSGGPVLQNSAPLSGVPTTPTHGSCVADLQIANGAYVAACGGSGGGITSLNFTTAGTSGPATASISPSTVLNLNIPNYVSANIANVNFTIPAGMVIPANSCYGPANNTTPGTFTMTGVLASPQTAVWPTWVGNPHSTNGWGQIGGLEFDPYVTSNNTVSWVVCNPTSGTINSGTPSFIIVAK